MRKMKNILYSLIVLALLLSMAACGIKKVPANEEAVTVAPEQAVEGEESASSDTALSAEEQESTESEPENESGSNVAPVPEEEEDILISEPAASSETQACTHVHTRYEIVTAAGCTAGGKAQYSCTDCGAVLSTVVLKAAGHIYSWQNDTTTHWQACTLCGDKTAAEKHTFNKNHVCTVCGYGCTHDFTDTVTKPTCEAAGYTTHVCKICGYTYVDSAVSATGHSYESKVLTAATCTQSGTMKYTCTACGSSFTATVEALGHSPVTDAAVAPTCQHTGLTEGSHCSQCNTVLVEQQELPKTDHVYIDGTCIYCHKSVSGGSTYTYELPKDVF